MFGILLESRARRQRRTGGAALSVAAHVAIIGTAAAFTVPRPAAPKPHIDVVRVAIVHDQPKSEIRRAETGARRPGPATLPSIDVQLPIPIMRTDIPPVDVSRGPPLDSLLLSSAGRSSGLRGRLGTLSLAGDSTGSDDWRGSEALMHVISQAKPRYPESLRQAGIDGNVLVQFRVDTLGLVDPASIMILSTTHDLFSRAVREALGGFRFRPAEVNGRKVVALAEMPFQFAIRR